MHRMSRVGLAIFTPVMHRPVHRLFNRHIHRFVHSVGTFAVHAQLERKAPQGCA